MTPSPRGQPDRGGAPPASSTVSGSERALRIVVPLLVLVAAIAAWQALVTVNAIEPYILPGPADVAVSLWQDSATLFPALLITLRTTFAALFFAVVGGVALAILLVQSRWIESALFPFAVILQVTPVVAVAPLLLIYAPDAQTALLIVAFLVAFFPILANMVAGLKSVDHGLLDVFRLQGASRWQTLLLLRLPTSLPFFMTGLRIGGGLALIAAVVAEFVAGTAGPGAGLAFRLIEAQYRLNMPRVFAALVLLALAGVAIFALTSFISWLTLHRWHDSATSREN